MNIGFISDLHIDNFSYQMSDYIASLSKLISKKQLETLVIGGDISNSYSMTTSFVEELQSESGVAVYFVPGNHDLWDRETPKDNIDTMALYEKYKNHPQCLIESPIMLNNKVGLVGHTAWYNYMTYNKEKFSEEKIIKGKYKGVTWQDKKYVKWPKSDKQMSKYFKDLVEKDIQSLNADQYIIVTHIVTIPEFTMPIPHRIFDFFNAYIATDDFNDIYKQYPISHSFMGHVHFRGQIYRDNIYFITNSLCYVKEWRSNNMNREMEDALLVITL